MVRKMSVPFVWLVVLVLSVGLACDLGRSSSKDDTPTKPAPAQKPTKPSSVTRPAPTKAPTEPPTAEAPQPTQPPEPTAEVERPTAEPVNNLGDPNASQSGEVYFSTEFDNADGWYLISVPKVEDTRYRVFPDNGQLYMEINPPDVTLYALYDLTLNNADVQVDTVAQKVAGPNTNNLSVICRASDDGWYEFSMTSGGYWYIWLYFDNEYTLLTKGATTAINMKNAANQLTAVCYGSSLTFYINGIEVGSVVDRTLVEPGQVGVSVYSEYPNLGVVFEWFSAIVP